MCLRLETFEFSASNSSNSRGFITWFRDLIYSLVRGGGGGHVGRLVLRLRRRSCGTIRGREILSPRVPPFRFVFTCLGNPRDPKRVHDIFRGCFCSRDLGGGGEREEQLVLQLHRHSYVIYSLLNFVPQRWFLRQGIASRRVHSFPRLPLWRLRALLLE